MGNIIRFTHADCEFKYDFYEGVGFSLFEHQCKAKANMRSGRLGKHWKAVLNEHPDGAAVIQNALCHCPTCKKLYTQPRIEFYIPKAGKKYESDDPAYDVVPSLYLKEHYEVLEKEPMICPICKGLSEVEEDYDHVPCPRCGLSLNAKICGNWD